MAAAMTTLSRPGHQVARVGSISGVRRAATATRRTTRFTTKASASVSDGEFRCRMTAEGHLVCERLEPGNYKVQGVLAKDAAASTAGDVSFCYVLDDGSIVCEGLPSGEYAISKATDADLSEMVAHASKLAGLEVRSGH